MSTANRRPSSWLLVVALAAGVGVGLWAGLGLREADQGRPPERGERFGSPPAGGAAEGGGLAASPTGPLERPATRASAGRPEPSVPEGLTLLEQRVGQGAYTAALPLAEQLLASEPRYRERVTALLVRAAAGLASRAIEVGQPGQALRWLDRGLDAAGDDGQLHLLSARAYRALGDDANARYHFERAARFEPALTAQVAAEVRALTLEDVGRRRAAGQTESALALLTEAVQRYPGDAEYQRALAELRLERGELDAAAAAVERALALGGDRYGALALRVRELRRERDERGATRVPLEVRDGVLSVAVRINDATTPLRFLLDTGASHTAIAGNAASALGLRVLPGAAPVQVSTANGRTTALPTVLRSVAVADLRVEEVPALILDGLHGADGLLGLSFLQHFHVELRPETGYLALRPR